MAPTLELRVETIDWRMFISFYFEENEVEKQKIIPLKIIITTTPCNISTSLVYLIKVYSRYHRLNKGYKVFTMRTKIREVEFILIYDSKFYHFLQLINNLSPSLYKLIKAYNNHTEDIK